MGALDGLRSLLTDRPHVYQPTMLEFLPIDQARVRSDMRLAELGAERGARNQPSAESQALDDIESRITLFIETEKRRWHQQFLDELATLHRRLTTLNLETRLSEVTATVRQAIGEFKAQIHEGQNQLTISKDDVVRSEKYLEHFRNQHDLIRPAVYPESKLLHWGVIAILFLVETVLNATFLARGHEFGLLGGYAQALGIAVMNIGGSLIIGTYIARQTNHRFLWRKLGSGILLAGYIGFVGIFNLGVAHYRDALGGPAPEKAAQAAVAMFQANPLGVTDFESWMMVGLGCMFALIALIDGYKMDDRYPGYGALDRAHRVRLDDYSDQMSDLIGQLKNTRDDATQAMQDLYRDLVKRGGEHDAILASRTRLINGFNAHLAYLESAANELLASYRQANRSARNLPPPEHFDQAWVLQKPDDPEPPPHTIAPERLAEILRAMDQESKQAVKDLHDAFDGAVVAYRQIDQLKPAQEQARAASPAAA